MSNKKTGPVKPRLHTRSSHKRHSNEWYRTSKKMPENCIPDPLHATAYETNASPIAEEFRRTLLSLRRER